MKTYVIKLLVSDAPENWVQVKKCEWIKTLMVTGEKRFFGVWHLFSLWFFLQKLNYYTIPTVPRQGTKHSTLPSRVHVPVCTPLIWIYTQIIFPRVAQRKPTRDRNEAFELKIDLLIVLLLKNKSSQGKKVDNVPHERTRCSRWY